MQKAEGHMLSGEQIGAHPVRSVTGASNVRGLIFGQTKPPGLNRPRNPSVTGSPGRSILRTRSGQRGSLFRRMSSLFRRNKFPAPCRTGKSSAAHWNCSTNGPQNAAKSTEMTGNFKNSLLISLLSGNPRLAAAPVACGAHLKTATAWPAAPAAGPAPWRERPPGHRRRPRSARSHWRPAPRVQHETSRY